MTATVVAPLATVTGPQSSAYGQLPFQLDLACPIPLHPKAVTGVAWPFPLISAAPSRTCLASTLRQRYLETLYLPDIIFPLETWLSDMKALLDISSDSKTETRALGELAASVLSLRQLETRHRKTLLPIVSRLISTDTVEQDGDVSSSSHLIADELDVLKVAVDLRMNNRRASEGDVPTAKKLSTEFERREALMQVVLLLLLLNTDPPPSIQDESKKRKRSKRESSENGASVDPGGSLELLMDRIGVWNAVEEMGIGADDIPSATGQETGFQAMLKQFWRSIVVPNFLATHPETCASFHLKVFGHPMPPDLLAPPTSKNPRKPKMTRSRPSSDAIPPIRRNSSSFSQSGQAIPTIRRNSSSFSQLPRAPSRAPSETGSRASADDLHGMRRSLSKTSESMPEYHRSRSRSIDPPAMSLNDNLGEATKQNRKFGRAPSGATLFKGRQVGFVRRPSGVIGRKDKDPASQGPVESQSQNRGGLLGRKLSDVLRGPAESQGTERAEGTLIFATPSKPKLAETLFGPRLSKFVAPTPIQEEPSSGERSMAPLIAETPIHVRYFDNTVNTSSHSSFALETPHLSTSRVVDTATSIRFADMPISQLSAGDDESDGTYHDDDDSEDGAEESDDPLAGLMVMTDDEVDDAVVGESPI